MESTYPLMTAFCFYFQIIILFFSGGLSLLFLLFLMKSCCCFYFVETKKYQGGEQQWCHEVIHTELMFTEDDSVCLELVLNIVLSRKCAIFKWQSFLSPVCLTSSPLVWIKWLINISIVYYNLAISDHSRR